MGLQHLCQTSVRLQVIRSDKSAREEQHICVIPDLLEQTVRLNLKTVGSRHHLSSHDGDQFHIHFRSSQAVTHREALHLFHSVCHKRIYSCHFHLRTFLIAVRGKSLPYNAVEIPRRSYFFVTVQYPHSYEQKSIPDRLRRWDFCLQTCALLRSAQQVRRPTE